MADVFFEVSADFSQAVSQLGSFSKEAQKSAKQVESAFAGIGTAVKAAFAGIAAIGVGKAFSEIVSAGLEAEKSQKKLTSALRLTGEATSENVKAFQEYAETLSLQTGIDDDLITSQVAFLKSLGATNAQVKEIISAATDLSAALGQDLSVSVEQLAKTYQGSAGALGKLVPGLNNLTKAQLANGDAVRIVREQLNGLAQQGAQGVAGSLSVLQISFRNLVKTIGSVVLSSKLIPQVIQSIAKAFQELSTFIKGVKLSEVIEPLARISGFIGTIAVIRGLAVAFQVASAAVTLFSTNLAIAQARGSAGFFSGLIAGAQAFVTTLNLAKIAVSVFKATLTLGLSLAIDQFIQLSFAVGSVGRAFEVVGNGIKRFFFNIAASVLQPIADVLKTISSIPGGIGEQFGGIAERFSSAAESARGRASELTVEIDSAFKATRATASETVKLDDGLKASVSSARGLGRELSNNRSEIENQVKSLRSELAKASSTASEQLASEFRERITLINKAQRAAVISGQEAAKLRGQAEQAAILNAQKIQEQADKDRLEKLQRRLQVVAANPIQLAFDNIKAPDISPFAQDVAGGITGALNIAAQGASGAGNLFSNIAGAAANAIIPGLGQAVGPIVDLLAQGPEKVKETFTAFFENLPTVLENIILALPALVEALANAIGPLIERLLEAIPAAIESLFQRLPEVAVALIEGAIRASVALATQMPFVAARLALSLTLEMPKVAIKFVDQLVKEAPRFISELIKSLPGQIGGVFGGGGGGGGIIGGIRKTFGFAQGGRIPDVAALRGDRGLVRVDAGEQIFSRDLTNQLEQFLSGQTSQGAPSNQPIQVNLMVGTDQLASALFQINREGWRTA